MVSMKYPFFGPETVHSGAIPVQATGFVAVVLVKNLLSESPVRE